MVSKKLKMLIYNILHFIRKHNLYLNFSEYTVEFGLWKRCFNSPMGMKIEKPENGSDQIITLENPPVCLNRKESRNKKNILKLFLYFNI